MRQAKDRAEAITEMVAGLALGAFVEAGWTDDEILEHCHATLCGIRAIVSSDPAAVVVDKPKGSA